MAGVALRHDRAMTIDTWWPQLTDSTRDWLIEHNGEPLAPDVKAEILEITGGSTDPTGWAGDTSDDGESELTDEAVDWIEAAANAESES